jgi:hypothetical protein
MTDKYQLSNQEERSEKEEEKPEKSLGCRNKIVIFLIVLSLLILVGLVIFLLGGGNFNILADRADYVAQQPGQAATNFAQHGQVKGESGRICGVARNFSGQIIVGAKIEIVGVQINWTTQTDPNGQYCIPPLGVEALRSLGEVLVGNYNLRVTADGYHPQIREVRVESGKEKLVNFTLSSVKDELLPGAY